MASSKNVFWQIGSLIGFVTMFFVFISGSTSADVPPQHELTDEEYQVFAAALSPLAEYQKSGEISGTVWMSSKTTPYKRDQPDDGTLDYVQRQSNDQVEQETWEDFTSKLREEIRLKPDNLGALKYSLIKREDFITKLENHEQPGYLRGISRVGFNSNKSQALVYTWYSCFGLCGGGYFVILERDPDNQWIISHVVPMWNS